jgi:hypothetical protein
VFRRPIYNNLRNRNNNNNPGTNQVGKLKKKKEKGGNEFQMWNLCVSIETRVENWSNREKEKEKE